MYDLIIIGMGIAGISGAIYAKRAGLKVLVLEEDVPGGIINKIAKIENYPGFKEISGPDLAYNLFETINSMDIEYKLEKVTDVIFEDVKTIKTTKNVYQAKKVLIATGRKPKFLNLENEKEYLGKGISTCALCDGALYKNEEVAVVGGGSSALSEALYLANIVKKVYLIHRREDFRGENTLIAKIKEKNNIDIILNNEVKEYLIKENKLVGIKLKDDIVLDVKAVFLYIGYEPNTRFLVNSSIRMDDGYIIVDKYNKTNIDGVYAAGDVIKKDIYQLITAASEGSSAVINLNN